MIALFFGVSFLKPYSHAFDLLLNHNLIPVTSAAKNENQVVK
jgi:hypothetical protein